jgi:predicted nucleic acid-binding protein
VFLNDFTGDERIFIDANIFLYNALDNPAYAEPCSDFLRLVETNQIEAVITPAVMDEVLFKILVSEASQHIDKFNLWNLKKQLNNSNFCSSIYRPVKEYAKYLKELANEGLEILGVDERTIEKSVDLGERYGLLTTDAIHLSAMKQYGIMCLATNDSDFDRVDSIRVYNPKKQ